MELRHKKSVENFSKAIKGHVIHWIYSSQFGVMLRSKSKKQENFRKTRKFKCNHLNKHKINNNSSNNRGVHSECEVLPLNCG